MLSRLEDLDRRATSLLSRYGAHCLRVGMGIVFVLFGAMKYVPGLSPAEGLVAETVGWAVDPTVFLPLLATWEVAIGVGLLANRFRRATLLLLFAHMGGTFMPLVVCPELVWDRFPFGFTLEGQYIIKNLVLIGGALTLFGRLEEESRREAARPLFAISGSRVPSSLQVTRVSPQPDLRDRLDRHRRAVGE